MWQASTHSILWGAALIVSGMLGGSLLLAAISVNLVIAWLIVLAGMVHLIAAHRAHRAGGLTWRLMIGFAYVLFGVYLIASPGLGSFFACTTCAEKIENAIRLESKFGHASGECIRKGGIREPGQAY